MMACLSEKEGSVPQRVVHNFYADKRRGCFWNVFLPDTSVCGSFRCLDSGIAKVCESDWAARILLHREEGRSANVSCPGTCLSLNCSWRCFTSAKDSATWREGWALWS